MSPAGLFINGQDRINGSEISLRPPVAGRRIGVYRERKMKEERANEKEDRGKTETGLAFNAANHIFASGILLIFCLFSYFSLLTNYICHDKMECR